MPKITGLNHHGAYKMLPTLRRCFYVNCCLLSSAIGYIILNDYYYLNYLHRLYFGYNY